LASDAGENLPVGHHARDDGVAKKLPASQVAQLVNPGESANVPVEQAWHVVDDVLGLMAPAKQLLHVGWSIADVNWPGRHLDS
jgi:hypothetical protein